jgi:hypothetical protein
MESTKLGCRLHVELMFLDFECGVLRLLLGIGRSNRGYKLRGQLRMARGLGSSPSTIVRRGQYTASYHLSPG